MKKIILFFCCFLAVASVTLNAQEIRPMPADSAYGVVHISVCNLRDEGKFTSGMSTQALLGMPVKVLQYTGWYEIQTPDDYTGWVHRMVITPMSKERYNEWNRAEKIVVTAHYGFTYEKPDEKSQTVSDVVAGNRLKWEGSKGHFYKVSYPDGRQAYFQIDLTAGDKMESFSETGCGEYYRNCIYYDRHSLSVGRYFFQRSRLQRSGSYGAVHA